jgi:hypothetical protein
MVFVLFFILARFVPSWPLLFVIGVIWLIAKLQSGRGKEPPPDEGVEDRPEPPPDGGGDQRWIPFRRTARRESKPFFRETKR